MSLDINMEKVYEAMEPVSDVMNQTYDYLKEFMDGAMNSIGSVSTIFG